MTEQKGSLPFNPSYGYAGSYTPDNLVNGDFDQVRMTVDLEDKQTLKRGSILAPNDKGKFVLVQKGKEQTSDCILSEDCNNSQHGVVYLTGEFNENDIILGSGADLPRVKQALRKLSIFLSESQREGK